MMKVKNLSKRRAWAVNTEGDIEGRSLKDLGTYWGNVLEVITALGDKQLYGLCLTPLDLKKKDVQNNLPKNNPPKEIHLSAFNLSDSKEELLNQLKKDFPDKDFCLSNYYHSVKYVYEKSRFNFEEKKEENVEEIKQKALNKLTDLEKKVLGLN